MRTHGSMLIDRNRQPWPGLGCVVLLSLAPWLTSRLDLYLSKHYTQHTHTSHSRTSDFVSLGSRLESSRLDSFRHPGLTTCGQSDGKRHVRSSATKGKTNVGYRKTEACYFIDPADAEFKETFQNALSKLEVPMPAAMLCKIRRGTYKETCRTPDAPKTKKVCIVEAGESMGKRLKGTLHKDHADHIAGKGINSLNHYKSRAQVYSYA